MLSFNKGEWAEIYCLLRVMYERQLLGVNHELRRTEEIFPVFGGFLKLEATQNLKFKLGEDAICFENESLQYRVEYGEIDQLSINAFKVIQSAKGTFRVEAVESFFKKLNCHNLKANAKDKADLRLSLWNPFAQEKDYFGFTVKSFLGANPTLVNASKPTNFTFRTSIPIQNKSCFASLKSKKLCAALLEHQANLKFESMDNATYENNLMKIDLSLPTIIAEVLKTYYSSKNIKQVKDLVAKVRELNPLQLKNTMLYEDKITDFLFYSAVGMVPNQEWTGREDIEGGCLIVQESGSVKTFYFLKNDYIAYFRRYLFERAYLDTASNSRHGFGSLYEKEGQVFLKLNLQVRVEKIKNSPC